MDRSDATTGERGTSRPGDSRGDPSSEAGKKKGSQGKGRLAPSSSPSTRDRVAVAPPVGTVTPIRDVPDEYVFRFELGPAILAQLLETLGHIPETPISEAIS